MTESVYHAAIERIYEHLSCLAADFPAVLTSGREVQFFDGDKWYRVAIYESDPEGCYCNGCGAGRNPDGSYRLPRGYPFDQPCEKCQLRTATDLEELGRQQGLRMEREVLKALLKED